MTRWCTPSCRNRAAVALTGSRASVRSRRSTSGCSWISLSRIEDGIVAILPQEGRDATGGGVTSPTMVRPVAHSRDGGGLPGPEFYARLDPGTSLYLDGNADLFRNHLVRIGSIAFEQTGKTGWNLTIFQHTPAKGNPQPFLWPESDFPASLRRSRPLRQVGGSGQGGV